ncbi:MAG TPA: ABC transporter permease, partial [Paenibacillaceae bacterium]|nr:ABC transporter permease [Paenibacillaceae bacterium]
KVMNMGANKITVQAKGTPLKQGLSQRDVEEISAIHNIKGVSPSISGKTSIVYNGDVMENITIQGRNQVYFANTEDLIDKGRGINILDCDYKNRVCLIGQNIVDEYFKTESPIDKDISINGITYTVVGTLQKSSGYSMDSNDNGVIIPYTTAMGLLGTGYINSVDVYMENGDLSDETTSEIERVLNTAFNYNENGYSVSNMQNIINTVADMTSMMTALLVGIASIALVVGGIGIMNMMLVSVTERTTEIGLRKALGAEPKTIQWQFLLEALFLSLFGGILGLVAGIAIAFVACLIIGTSFSIAGYSVILALGFSSFIGLTFGYAPARRASKLNPIDALRSV